MRRRLSDMSTAAKPNTFFIDDKRDRHPRGRDDLPRRRAASTSSCRTCATRRSPATAPDGNCRVCMVEIEGERVLAASCIRTPSPGMKVKTQTDRAKTARRMVAELLMTDQPALEVAHDPDFELWKIAKRQKIEAGRFPKREPIEVPRARPQPLGDGGQSRRLHPVQSLRPRLPRGAGQRRHRHGRPRPSREDRVRLRRPDGRLDLRRLRRMRAGLPDRRADAGDAWSTRTTSITGKPDRKVDSVCPYCGVGCQLTYQIKDDKLVSVDGTQRPGQPEPAVREGPLRLRLRRQSAAPDQADDPQGRRRRRCRTSLIDPANPWTHFREATWEEALDRAAAGLKKIRDRDGPQRAGRLRLGQGLERGGLSVPEAGAHRLRHQQRRPLHAALPRLVGGGAAGRRRLGRRDRDLQRVQELRRHHRHRRQPDREPSGRRDLLQAGRQARRQADRDGPARPGAQAPRLADDAVQERHRRRDAQRACSTSSSSEKLYDQQYVQTYVEGFEQLAESVKAVHAGGDGADLRHRGRTCCARSRAPSPAPRARSSSGAWACRSTPTAPTTRAA